ncbi:MAG: hypothetical protein K2J18_00240, partial [Paramuribaculum sp.]|nr:hypothetical protein [Paramuribaculum sp.]
VVFHLLELCSAQWCSADSVTAMAICFFRLCPLIIILASLTTVWIHTVTVLLVCLFLMGFAVGGEAWTVIKFQN